MIIRSFYQSRTKKKVRFKILSFPLRDPSYRLRLWDDVVYNHRLSTHKMSAPTGPLSSQVYNELVYLHIYNNYHNPNKVKTKIIY
jgi:hypothetical protein